MAHSLSNALTHQRISCTTTRYPLLRGRLQRCCNLAISENVPVNDTNPNGGATVKHWNQTQELLEKKLEGGGIFYAVTLHQGKTVSESDDDKFEDFVEYLVDDKDN